MFINLIDSNVRIDSIVAVAKSLIPATNFTPEYYTMCIYLQGVSQPLIHSYATETERDDAYNALCEILNG